MRVGKLAILLTLCVFSVDTEASNMGAVDIPLDWLLNENCDPSIQIRNIMDREVEWFNTYFQAVKASGRDLNMPLRHGETLLHFAVNEGSVNMVRALLAAGVDVYKPNNDGATAVEFAHSLAAGNYDYNEIWSIFRDAGIEAPAAADDSEEEQGECMQGNYSEDDEASENQEEDYMDDVDPVQDHASSSAGANTSSPGINSTSTGLSSPRQNDDGMESPILDIDEGNIDFDPRELIDILRDPPKAAESANTATDTSVPPAAMEVSDTTVLSGNLLRSNVPLPIPSRYEINIPLYGQIPDDKLTPGVQYTVI